MNKTKIIVLIVSFLIIGAGTWFGYSYFSKTLQVFDHPFDAIPDNNAFIVEFSSGEAMQKIIASDTGFLPVLFAQSDPDSIFPILKNLSNVFSSIPDYDFLWKNSKIYFSSHFMGIDKFSYLVSIQSNKNIDQDDFVEILKTFGKSKWTQIEGRDVLILSIKHGKSIYITLNKGMISIAFDAPLIQKVILFQKQNKVISKDPLVMRMIKISGQGEAHLFVNHDFFYRFLAQFAPEYRDNIKFCKNIASRSEFDISLQNNNLVLTGYSIFSDSVQSYSKVLATNTSVSVSHFDILPINTIFLSYQGAGDFTKFYHDMNGLSGNENQAAIEEMENRYNFSIEENILPWINGELSFCITSGTSDTVEDAFAVITTTDVNEAWQQLEKIANNADIVENLPVDTFSYRSFPVRELKIEAFLPAIFGSQFKPLQKFIFTKIDNYIVISNNRQACQRFVDFYLIGQKLSANPNFTSLGKYRSDKMNLYYYLDLNSYSSFFSRFLSGSLDTVFGSIGLNNSKLGYMALEISSEENGAFTGLVFGVNEGDNQAGIFPLSWQEAIDAEVVGQPFIFTNPLDGKRELLIFDRQNFLNRIDEDGKLVWRIPMLESPLSSIQMIDYQKNGQVQFLFNSANYLYLIDIDGNRVDNYPFKLPLVSTGSMSLIDYNQNKDYRILIPLIDGKLHNFTLDKKPTIGWPDPAFGRQFITPIENYRIANKDFLLFADSLGNVVFANRKGEARMEAKLGFTNNPNTDFFSIGQGVDSKLLTTDLMGRIIKIDNSGNVEKIFLNEFSANHQFQFGDFDFDGKKDYVFFDNQRLSVFNMENSIIFDTVIVGLHVDRLATISLKMKSGISLILHNSYDNTLVFVTSDGTILNTKEFISSKDFIIDEATKNQILRLITFNKRVVSNFLIN